MKDPGCQPLHTRVVYFTHDCTSAMAAGRAATHCTSERLHTHKGRGRAAHAPINQSLAIPCRSLLDERRELLDALGDNDR